MAHIEDIRERLSIGLRQEERLLTERLAELARVSPAKPAQMTRLDPQPGVLGDDPVQALYVISDALHD